MSKSPKNATQTTGRPKFEVEEVELDRIIPYHQNPRKNLKAIKAVRASLREFGPRQPVVVDENFVVIVGHTRLLAARELGWKTFPVHVAHGLTPAQAKAYRIADNRTNEDAEWDPELLAVELDDLRDEGFDLDLTGFNGAELVEMLGAATPKPPKEPSIRTCPECGHEF